jgi:hypothetical protein
LQKLLKVEKEGEHKVRPYKKLTANPIFKSLEQLGDGPIELDYDARGIKNGFWKNHPSLTANVSI